MKLSRVPVLIAAAAFAIPVLPGCKKGEEDPFLSLRSRTARVAGEWIVETYEVKLSTNKKPYNDNIVLTESSQILSGNILTETTTVTINTQEGEMVDSYKETQTKTFHQAINFDKEGGYTKLTTEIFTEVDTVEYDNPVNGVREVYQRTWERKINTDINGAWNFLGSVGDVKNKEFMTISNDEISVTEVVSFSYTLLGNTAHTAGVWEEVIEVEPETETYKTVDECSDCKDIWHLTELRNDRITADVELHWKNTTTDTDNQVSTEETAGVMNIVLVQE